MERMERRKNRKKEKAPVKNTSVIPALTGMTEVFCSGVSHFSEKCPRGILFGFTPICTLPPVNNKHRHCDVIFFIPKKAQNFSFCFFLPIMLWARKTPHFPPARQTP